MQGQYKQQQYYSCKASYFPNFLEKSRYIGETLHPKKSIRILGSNLRAQEEESFVEGMYVWQYCILPW
jgi:hypothetical protein